MRPSLYHLTGPFVLFAVLLGIYEATGPEFAAEVGSGRGQEFSPVAALEAWRAGLMRRTVVGEEIARELAAGCIDLAEAAARYRDLYRGMPPSQWRMFRRIYPGASDEERFCRALVRELEVALPDGDDKDVLLASLRADLEGRLASGTLRLPD
jgi:hypothetical protein